ncbi:uncharacterized protein LOC110944934 [Helianthus annuus]|uniref:uncharacterized protein LOC110944934 n=1 Tax=Helianthus annuus TaxID=4232 RepID=UPI000B90909F|nr:uncharacterized protein LOC110944934 [Helianthus annuus]
MNCLSINLRGVRDSRKSDWIRGIKISYGIHFLAIQETKLSDSTSFMFSKFWGRSAFNYEVVESHGRSGGLACLWCPSMFRCVNSIKHMNFIVVSGIMVHTGTRINMLNIYAPNEAGGRRSLWLELLAIRNSIQGLWILMGDFNEVRNESERMNSEFFESNAEAFNHFILSAGLVEYNMGGGRFTYISDNGDKLSKLDRYLVCLGVMERWPSASVLALERVASDHRPIILSMIQSDFGHIPFRFFNSWFDLPGFKEYVQQVSSIYRFTGPEDLALAIKLRWLKNKIKTWLKAEKTRREGLFGEKKRRLVALENEAENRRLEENELEERIDCRNFLAEFDRIKNMDIRQKSRARWALEGDENSTFFHQIINSNISTNRINGLMVDNIWITNPAAIKEIFYDFFSISLQNRRTIDPRFSARI